MAEVTKEMVLEYILKKGGVVKNVDLVRHFRKHLQVEDPRRKDHARELFKERVNAVAYIKADKGEKYLHIRPEYQHKQLSQPPAGHSKLSNGERVSVSSIDDISGRRPPPLNPKDSLYNLFSDQRSSVTSPTTPNNTTNYSEPYTNMSSPRNNVMVQSYKPVTSPTRLSSPPPTQTPTSGSVFSPHATSKPQSSMDFGDLGSSDFGSSLLAEISSLGSFFDNDKPSTSARVSGGSSTSGQSRQSGLSSSPAVPSSAKTMSSVSYGTPTSQQNGRDTKYSSLGRSTAGTSVATAGVSSTGSRPTPSTPSQSTIAPSTPSQSTIAPSTAITSSSQPKSSTSKTDTFSSLFDDIGSMFSSFDSPSFLYDDAAKSSTSSKQASSVTAPSSAVSAPSSAVSPVNNYDSKMSSTKSTSYQPTSSYSMGSSKSGSSINPSPRQSTASSSVSSYQPTSMGNSKSGSSIDPSPRQSTASSSVSSYQPTSGSERSTRDSIGSYGGLTSPKTTTYTGSEGSQRRSPPQAPGGQRRSPPQPPGGQRRPPPPAPAVQTSTSGYSPQKQGSVNHAGDRRPPPAPTTSSDRRPPPGLPPTHAPSPVPKRPAPKPPTKTTSQTSVESSKSRGSLVESSYGQTSGKEVTANGVVGSHVKRDSPPDSLTSNGLGGDQGRQRVGSFGLDFLKSFGTFSSVGAGSSLDTESPPPSHTSQSPPSHISQSPPSHISQPRTSQYQRLGPTVESPTMNSFTGSSRRESVDGRRQGSMDTTPFIRVDSPSKYSDTSSVNERNSPVNSVSDSGRGRSPLHTNSLDSRQRLQTLSQDGSGGRLASSLMAGLPSSNERLSGVQLRNKDGKVGRTHSNAAAVRRSRNLDKTHSNLENKTRQMIMATPPAARRNPRPGLLEPPEVAPKPISHSPELLTRSREDVSQYGDEEGSGSIVGTSEPDYWDIDPLEKEWMLATSQADMENLHRLIMTDSSLVNRKDFINGYTAMHWAAKQGRCDIIAALAMNGAIVDLKSNGGLTPLHLAAAGGHDNAIQMLITEHGANVNIRDHGGRRAIDVLNYKSMEQTRLMLSKVNNHGLPPPKVQRMENFSSFSRPRSGNTLNRTWSSVGDIDKRHSVHPNRKQVMSSIRKSFSFKKTRIRDSYAVNDSKTEKKPKTRNFLRPVSDAHAYSQRANWDV